MPVGSTWIVYMSPDLAYGQYAPPVIGPNQALTFKIQLISIGAPKAQSSTK
jgi:FKBP-type peptidyl-prolyl cis-trans isomerase